MKSVSGREDFLNGIIASAMDAIVVVDESQRIIIFNPAAERMFGCTSQEAVGGTLDRFIPERFRTAHREHLRRFGDTQTTQRRMGELGTVYGLRSDGNEFPIEASISYTDVSGQKLSAIIMRDIGERVRDQAIKAHLAAIVASSDDAILGETLDGTITSWNEGAERLFGFQREEVLGKPVSIIIPPERAEELAHILASVGQGGGVEQLETVRLKSAGTRVDVSVTISPIRDKGGEVVGASVIARDISERKRAEENLLRTAAELEEAQRIARLGCWTWEPRRDTVTWSEEIFQAYGMDPKLAPPPVTGSEQRYTPEGWAQLQAALQAAIRHGTPYEIDLQVIGLDGTRRWITVRGEAQLGKDGQIARLRGTVQDITDRKRQEGQLLASLQEKELLLKEVHHRVKNNLQVISSLLGLAGAGGGDRESLEILRESQSRVRTMALIHEKLYQSRDFSHVDFGEYVRGLVTDLFRSYRPDPESVSLSVQTDRVLLGVDSATPCALIVNELVSNCFKHAFPPVRPGLKEGAGESGAPKRPGIVSVALSLVENNRVRLVVSDNGPGFPKSLDFRHARSLGLQLVNTLTSQLGGTIEMRSEGGTEFQIEFPA